MGLGRREPETQGGVARPEFPADDGVVISPRGLFPRAAVVEAEALPVHFEDMDMMGETVEPWRALLIRRSLAYASYKERRALAGALKTLYRAPTQAAAEEALDAFEAGPWGQTYPAITRSWRSAWEHVVPFFAFSQPIRRAIYTTNAIESLNSTVRRAVRTRGHFPNDRAATKLIYLALCGVQRKWRATRCSGTRCVRSSQSASANGSWWRNRDPRFHRLPTGAWANEGPAPVDSPWKSLRAPLRRRTSTATSGLRAADPRQTATVTKYGRSNRGRPGRPKHGIPDTTLRATSPPDLPPPPCRCPCRGAVPVPDEVVREESAEHPRAPARPVTLDPRHKTPIVVIQHRQRDRAKKRERVHVSVDPRLGRRRRIHPNV